MGRPIVMVNKSTLTIVIPALNEEAAIRGTLLRCLEARPEIVSVAGLEAIELIVVSDGSTDRTAELAREVLDQQEHTWVVEFPENRGYGAAIQYGWSLGSGDLLGFLDADGTCDPAFFAKLCRIAIDDNADVVLGSRMGSGSRMPAVRRFGNRVYAALLGCLCGRFITDTASGMRVVRRRALSDLLPLPFGLHFTPAMSARALLNHLRVIETPMSYEERVGESKLHVLRDGIRFLRSIFDGVLVYRPENLFLVAAHGCLAVTLLLAANPVEHYFRQQRVEDWMIYRFAACSFLATVWLTLLLATILTFRISAFSRRRPEARPFLPGFLSSLFTGTTVVLGSAFAATVGIWFLAPGLAEWFRDGHVYFHWSRLMAGVFCLNAAVQIAVFGLLARVAETWFGEDSAIRRLTTRDESVDLRGKASGVDKLLDRRLA